MNAAAYVHIRSTQNGASVQWNPGSNVVLRVNTANASGLAASDIFTILTSGVQRWIQASNGGLAFTYYQGTDTSRYPNHLNEPQDNAIFFTSQDPGEPLSNGIIGLTEVWYDLGSGRIQHADMRLNDTNYRFSTNPEATAPGSETVYLGDVATHELGHVFGLDHSQNAQSTMFYAASKEMFKPSCDDQAAMQAAYVPGGTSRTGTITGNVAMNGAAVFGAVVNAVDLDRGITMAQALTEKDGSYEIQGLEPGVYAIMAEPYFPGASALNAYYSGIQSALCNGGAFQRTFDTAADGTLARASVSAGGNTAFGTLTLSCTAPASPFGNEESSLSTAPSLPLDANGVSAAVGVFSSNSDHYYKIPAASGTLTASALAYTLYSRVDTQVEFLDSSGRSLAAQSLLANVYESFTSGYTNFDSSSSVTLSTPQDIYVHVFTRANISPSAFPGSSQGIAATPYYVMSVSNRVESAPLYANNARCEQNDSFGPYTQAGDPPTYNNPSSSSTSSSGPGCGEIYDAGGDGSKGSGSGGTFRLLNFAALALALAVCRRKMLQKNTPIERGLF